MIDYFFIKRFIDIMLSIIFLLILWPVFLVFMLLIWMQDWHNPFYSHIRIGKSKREFRLYKFRSMVIDADDILFKDKKMYEKMRSGQNKLKNDPRITKIGSFIRKYSIDEFPQVYNVLKGDMSFIGPRALRPDEFDNYKSISKDNIDKLNKLVQVKPGITGYWQVNGRSVVDFDDRMRMERYYVENVSFWLDFKILLKTPLVVIKGEGAY